jgi:hypothetical protein
MVTSLVMILLLLLIWYCCRYEPFVSRERKAKSIIEWFGSVAGNAPKYNDFRGQLNNDTDIVEYEDALSLHNLGKLSEKNMVLKL